MTGSNRHISISSATQGSSNLSPRSPTSSSHCDVELVLATTVCLHRHGHPLCVSHHEHLLPHLARLRSFRNTHSGPGSHREGEGLHNAALLAGRKGGKHAPQSLIAFTATFLL